MKTSTTSTASSTNSANTASTSPSGSAQKKSRPAFALYAVDEQPMSEAAKAKLRAKGKHVAENAVERVWTKVGVAFPTKSGSGALTILLGEKGDPKQKRYLLCPTSALDDKDPDARLPVGHLFELSEGSSIDFRKKDGVAFVNRDDSYSILIGDKGDLEQVRLNMRREETRTNATREQHAAA